MTSTRIAAGMRFSTCIVPLALAAMLSLPAARLDAGDAIVDAEHGFTLTLPDGFKPEEQLAAASPRMIHAFVLGNTDDDELDIFLMIEQMRGTIGREPLQMEHMPPGFQGRLFKAQWQGYEVDAFEVPEQLGELKTITYNVQIPLKRKAIQLKLFGPEARRAELDRLLPEILGNLRGSTNWTDEPAPAPGANPASKNSPPLEDHRFMQFLAGVIATVLAALVGFYFISRVTPKGTVLFIAGALWMASYGIEANQTRTMLLVSGTMRMIGFAGILLGLFDVFRRRKPPMEVEQEREP